MDSESKFNMLRGITISAFLETEQKTELLDFIDELENIKEKTEPKEPAEVDERDIEGCYWLAFMCPACGESITGQPYKPNHCKHCGQRLGWSEEEGGEGYAENRLQRIQKIKGHVLQ